MENKLYDSEYITYCTIKELKYNNKEKIKYHIAQLNLITKKQH